jgi:hypothetical protein
VHLTVNVNPIALIAEPALWALVGVVAGGVVFYHGFRLLQRRERILDTPTSSVRGVSLGPVEVSGTAVAPYTLISPLSELDCYYYRAVAWEGSGSDEKIHWKKVGEESLCVPFFLDDGTGQLLIDPRGAELELHETFSEELSSPSSLAMITGSVRHFLGRRGLSGDRPAKLVEYCIQPRDQLFVFGTVRENPGVEFPSRSGSNQSPNPDSPFMSSAAADLQRRAAIPVNLPRVGSAAASRAEHTMTAREFDLSPAMVLMKGRPDEPFFISFRAQRDILSRLGWKSIFYIAGGAALILASAWLILFRMRLL